jgi:hypothetical protein
MTDINTMNGDRIKVVQLYYARAAADLGSFSRAAVALGVTQPALSHGIAALERTLGGVLFARTTTGVTTTAFARRVLPHLHSVLGSLDAMLTEARHATNADAEPLRLGVSPIIHPDLVGRAFAAARAPLPAASCSPAASTCCWYPPYPTPDRSAAAKSPANPCTTYPPNPTTGHPARSTCASCPNAHWSWSATPAA